MANLVEYVISLKDRFTAPMNNAQRQVQQFNNQVNNINKSTSKANGGILSMVGGIGGLGKMLAGGAILAGVKQVVTMGMEMEQTRVRFETFTGSVEKGNATIAQLQKFAIETPFNDEQVLKAGQSLLAFGTDAENLTPILKTLGNISSATGKDINELTTIYGKNKLSGIIQAEDLNQLTEAGIPIYESLAKQMGVSTDKVKEMGSKGKISFAMLEKSFDELGGEGGKWGDLMDKQSKTFGGRLSSLMGIVQNLGGQLGEMITPFLGKLVEGATTLMNFINSNKEALGAMFTPLQEAFQPLMDAFSEVMEIMGFTGDSGTILENVFNGIATVIKILSPFIKVLAQAIATVWVNVAKVVKAFIEWYKRTEWIQTAVKFLYVSFKTAFQDIGELATKVFGGIGDIIAGVFNADLSQIKKGLVMVDDGLTTTDEEKKAKKKRFEDEMKADFGVNLFGDKKNTAVDEVKANTSTTKTPFAPSGSKADATTDSKLSSAIGSATGSKSNTYNITITKLIESYTNQFTNVSESKEAIKNMVLQALTGAVSDLTTNLN